MPNKNTLERWQARQKARTLRILKELTKRIEKEQLIVNDAGFWPSTGSNEIIFRFIVLSRDSNQDSANFEQLK
jgi:hypothetical protein